MSDSEEYTIENFNIDSLLDHNQSNSKHGSIFSVAKEINVPTIPSRCSQYSGNKIHNQFSGMLAFM